jgi:hypothetical protein
MKVSLGGKSVICLAVALLFVACVPMCQAGSGSKVDKHAQKIEKTLSKFKTGTLLHLEFNNNTECTGTVNTLVRHIVYLQQFGDQCEGDPPLQRCFAGGEGQGVHRSGLNAEAPWSRILIPLPD